MTLTFSQQFAILLLKFIIRFLWVFDALSDNLVLYLQRVLVSVVGLGLIAGFTIGQIFGLNSQYFDGILQSMNFDVSSVPMANVLGASSAKKTPTKVNEIPFPEISAVSVLVVDNNSGQVLHSKNSDKKYASASTTKLMTALVALDVYKLDDVLEIGEDCYSIESTKAGLPIGTEYEVRNLISAMLIYSAGDAACVLANGNGNYGEFIFLMNQKAFKLKMNSTFFNNPIGLDGQDNDHFSSAEDLYKLAAEAMKSDVIRSIVKTKEFTIKSVDESYIGYLPSTNKLLWEIPNTVGIKTGTTAEAGQVLIYEVADDIKDLTIIVMGSEDRFTDTRQLLNWALATYEWR